MRRLVAADRTEIENALRSGKARVNRRKWPDESRKPEAWNRHRHADPLRRQIARRILLGKCRLHIRQQRRPHPDASTEPERWYASRLRGASWYFNTAGFVFAGPFPEQSQTVIEEPPPVAERADASRSR